MAWLSLATFGEWWHNNHHAFPTSAFHGLRRRELDLGGLFIRALERVGLAWHVVRVSPERLRLKAAAGVEMTCRLRPSRKADLDAAFASVSTHSARHLRRLGQFLQPRDPFLMTYGVPMDPILQSLEERLEVVEPSFERPKALLVRFEGRFLDWVRGEFATTQSNDAAQELRPPCGGGASGAGRCQLLPLVDEPHKSEATSTERAVPAA